MQFEIALFLLWRQFEAALRVELVTHVKRHRHPGRLRLVECTARRRGARGTGCGV
jgi:hypothetical protein